MMRFAILLLLFATKLSALSDIYPDFWTGHQLHGSPGFLITKVWPTLPDKRSQINFRTNPAFFYGYEYGFQFKKNWYVGGGLEWTLAYPRNFVNWREKATQEDRDRSKRFLISSWLQPLTHVRVGYVFDNHVLINIGLAYLWGLTFNTRFPMNEHVFVDLSYVQWLDRIFGVPKFLDTLLASFDAANVSLGVGYKF